ncbi:MAG: hypothetical protein K5906_00075 [Bacilli bacterium]|nr:hypothetical protein [Bacilli bacterium]
MKSLLKDKSVLVGLGLFTYFFLLLLGVMIPIFRLGTSGGLSTAFIYRAIIFTLFFIVVILMFYKKYHSVNYILAIFLAIFGVSNILAIFIPFGDIQVSYQLKWMSVLYMVSVIFTVFAFYEVLAAYIDNKSLITFFILLVATALVCALYSNIKEFDAIIKAFTASGEDAHFYQIHSFFDNKNSYGLVLFVAMLANIFLLIRLKNKWLIVPLVYLALNVIISRSKTALIALVLLGLLAGIYYFIKSFPHHKKRNIIIVSSLGVLVALFLIIVFVPSIYQSNTFFTHLSNYVREAFIGQAIRSLQDRFNNLALAKDIFLTPRILLGYGEHTCYSYANTCCYRLGYIDNAYIYNLLAGGIFKTALFIYCYYLIFKTLVKVYKSNVAPIFKVLSWGVVISILLYGLMENYQVLGSNHTSFIFLIYSYSIPTFLLKEVNNE